MAGPILFVCRGNYCRSPMAEGAFRMVAQRSGLQLECDSAGVAPEREGEAPDWRARMVAGRHGANIDGQRSRKVRAADFSSFSLILAMDAHNLTALERMTPPGSTARLALFLDMARGAPGRSLRDPFCGKVGDFMECWAKIVSTTRDLVAHLAA